MENETEKLRKDHDRHDKKKDDAPSPNHDNDRDRDEREGHKGHIIHPRPTHGGDAVRARLASSVQAMLQEAPAFVYHELASPKGIIGTWSGEAHPIGLEKDTLLLVD